MIETYEMFIIIAIAVIGCYVFARVASKQTGIKQVDLNSQLNAQEDKE